MGENLACVICEWIIKVEPSTFLHAFRIKAGEANRDPDFMAAFQGLDSKPLPFASLPFRQTKPLIFFRSCRAPFIILTSFRERSPLAKYLLLNGRLYWSRRNNGLYYVHQIKTLWAEDVCLSKKKKKNLNDFLLLAHESFLIHTNQFNVLQRYTALHEWTLPRNSLIVYKMAFGLETWHAVCNPFYWGKARHEMRQMLGGATRMKPDGRKREVE